MIRYYIVKNGKPYGPITLEELAKMGLKGTDFVKKEGWDDYKELREIPELSGKLGVEYERALPQYYATLDVRLLAATIDYFFAFAVYCIGALIVLLESTDKLGQGRLLLLGLILIPIVKFIINVCCEGSKKNASPGKMLLQIKVTDTKGNPIGFGRALWRNIAKITCVLTLGLGYLTGFLDRKQQCFHDKLAKTLVIKGRLL